jgi:molybdopterin synthase catalytic subunit
MFVNFVQSIFTSPWPSSRGEIPNITSMSGYLINSPILPDIISTHLSKLGLRNDTGGHSIFLGQVRDDILGGRRVTAIEYSAYEPMLNTEADKISDEIRKEFDDVISIVILHSAGKVKVGEISLMVIVSAGHRDHATRACRQAVELIKERLPVWKMEILEDNSHHWRENE